MPDHPDPQGLIFDIQRFSLDDGPGIRTTVFLKGCPLRCAWCHNPESQTDRPELFFTPDACLYCRACLAACPQGAHAFTPDGRHTLDRARCQVCGKCADACPARALERAGRPITVSAALAEIEKDRLYYDHSGGGVTLSGGEPLEQPAFTRALLTACHATGLHTALETCGHAPWDRLAPLLPVTDLFLFDYKETDPDRHRAFTGEDNGLILDNLGRLAQAGAVLSLRCPLIPGWNDRPDHFAGIAALANRYPAIREIRLLPFHPLGVSKSARLGKTNPLEGQTFPADAAVQDWRAAIRALTATPVL